MSRARMRLIHGGGMEIGVESLDLIDELHQKKLSPETVARCKLFIARSMNHRHIFELQMSILMRNLPTEVRQQLGLPELVRPQRKRFIERVAAMFKEI